MDSQAADSRFDDVGLISADESPVTVLVVPANEELMIARETLRALGRSCLTRARQTRPEEPILIEVSARHVHKRRRGRGDQGDAETQNQSIGIGVA